MKIIYLDTLFFVNFICDYFLLLCSAKCSGAVIRRLPIICASAIGGLYACMACLSPQPWLINPLIKLSLGILLSLIAYGREQSFSRCCLCFLCIAALFGGACSALSLSVDGVAYLPIDGKTVILAFTLVYFLLTAFFRYAPESKSQQLQNICIHFRSRKQDITVLQDTGNTLYEPVSNLPVLVCDRDMLQVFFPEIPLDTGDPYTLFFCISELPDCARKLKLIPYQTVDTQGFLLAFRPDTVTIDGKLTELYVALSPTAFSKHRTYQGIL